VPDPGDVVSADIVLGVLTTQLDSATTPLDYVLQDWAAAGLRQPSAFRAYFSMAEPSDVKIIGHLTDRDWAEIQERLKLALAMR